MGCFSFMCKESGLPVASSGTSGDAVRLYLLKDGEVIEEMVGHYNSYGQVFNGKDDSFEWEMDWSDVCDLIFSTNESDGIAAVLERHFNGTIPTTQSDSDPDQGWGEENGGGVIIDEPYHKVF